MEIIIAWKSTTCSLWGPAIYSRAHLLSQYWASRQEVTCTPIFIKHIGRYFAWHIELLGSPAAACAECPLQICAASSSDPACTRQPQPAPSHCSHILFLQSAQDGLGRQAGHLLMQACRCRCKEAFVRGQHLSFTPQSLRTIAQRIATGLPISGFCSLPRHVKATVDA